MEWAKKYPVVSIALLVLCCIRYEYNTETSRLVVPGLAGGIVVLGIIGIVLFYRIFNAVEGFCQAKGWLKAPQTHRYDVLIPIGIIAVAMKGEWYGGRIQGMGGEMVDRWNLRWSDGNLDEYFLLVLIAVVLLIRILELIRGLEVRATATQRD